MADTDPVQAALRVDRAPPVGSSPGTGGRHRLHVFIDTNGIPIPVDTSGQVQWDEIDATYPDSVTEVFSYKLLTVLQQTITVIYTDSTKDLILTVTKV